MRACTKISGVSKLEASSGAGDPAPDGTTLLTFILDWLDATHPAHIHAAHERRIEFCCGCRVSGEFQQFIEADAGQTVAHADGIRRHNLRTGVVETLLQLNLVADAVNQHLDRDVALHEGALTKRYIGIAALDRLEVILSQVVAAHDD